IFPEVKAVLEILNIQGIPVVLASNTDRSENERALLDAGIRFHFSHVLSAMDCEAPKPDPTVYMKAASATGGAKSDI
ncbi:HAD family hydrolase, partial [Streptococcus suis]